MKKNAIIRFLTKPYVYAIIFSIVLIACTTYSLLDVFVIPHYISAATDTSDNSDNSSDSSSQASASTETSNTGNVTTTSTSYEDDNIKVTITTIEKYDTTIYVADVEVSSPEYLQTPQFL